MGERRWYVACHKCWFTSTMQHADLRHGRMLTGEGGGPRLGDSCDFSQVCVETMLVIPTKFVYLSREFPTRLDLFGPVVRKLVCALWCNDGPGGGQ